MPFNTEDVILLRRANVAKRYLEGWTQARIAVEEGVSRSQISLDLQVLREEWIADAKSAIAEAKAKELAKIDYAEAELWEEWHKSKKPYKKKSTRMRGTVTKDETDPSKNKQVPGELETSEWTEERGADSRYMAQIRDFMRLRIELLGLAEPQKIQIEEKNLPAWLKAVNPLKPAPSLN